MDLANCNGQRISVLRILGAGAFFCSLQTQFFFSAWKMQETRGRGKIGTSVEKRLPPMVAKVLGRSQRVGVFDDMSHLGVL